MRRAREYEGIAIASDMSQGAVRQIMRTLSQAKQVTSNSGPHGDYPLNCVPETTSLRIVVEANEGAIDPLLCSPSNMPCALVTTRVVHVAWTSAQASLEQGLAAMSLREVL